MEKESFENVEIAKLLNDNFISVKVDREERPDIDRVYMSFVQALSGHGGWPLTVFITPEKQPFLGGTYFPPADTPFQTGFSSVLKLVSEKWTEDNAGTKNHAKHLSEIFADASKPKKFDGDLNFKDLSLKCYEYLSSSFDDAFGGFGIEPKFPEPSNLLFLCRFYAENRLDDRGKNALKMLESTLQHMANGGIHDHIGNGFHRYSVDKRWHIPHFEKMLYDQGQLLSVYARATMLGCDFTNVVHNIVDYVSSCLASPTGVFYSSEDADSLPDTNSDYKIEGSFYVWSKKEVTGLLEKSASKWPLSEIFCETYGITDDGNIREGELKGKNLPMRVKTNDQIMKKFALSDTDLKSALRQCLDTLSEARSKRPHCDLDNKIITGWNCLLITGILDAARALLEQRSALVEKAKKCMDFILKNVRRENGSLLRSAYVEDDGTVFKLDKELGGFSDDYAYFIQSAIDLYELTSNELYLQMAEETFEYFHKNFFDFDNKTGYFLSANTGEFFIRPMSEQDGAEPSTNSVAAMNCLRLGALLGREDLNEIASQIFKGSGGILSKAPRALPFMLNALSRQQQSPVQIILSYGRDEDKEICDKMMGAVLSHYIPNLALFCVNASKKDSWLLKRNSHLSEMLESSSGPTAMICRNFSCSLPIHSIEVLKAELQTL